MNLLRTVELDGNSPSNKSGLLIELRTETAGRTCPELDDAEQRLLFGLSKENGFDIDTLGMFSPIIGKKTTVDPIITIYC